MIQDLQGAFTIIQRASLIQDLMGFGQATAIQTSQIFTSPKRLMSAMKIVAFSFLAVYVAVTDAVSVTSRLQVNVSDKRGMLLSILEQSPLIKPSVFALPRFLKA